MRQRRINAILSIPVIKGSEPNGENENDDENENQNQNDNGSGGEGGSGGSPEGGEPRVYTQQDVDAIMKRLSGADKARVDAEKRVKEFEDASKSELDKAKSDAEEAKKRADAAEKELIEARVSNAFLTSSKHSWHDPETALALLDRSEIRIDDDGKIVGVKEAADALAKAKPFLLSDKRSDERSSGGNNGGGKPSGGQPSNNGSGTNKEKERQKLLEKYPALAMGR